MKSVVKTFLELVQIDSPSGYEDDVRKYILARLETKGIKSHVDRVGNVFAAIPGQGGPMILSGHMDTVEPGRGVKPVIEKGVIRSDGTTILGADNKVNLAAIIDTIENLPQKHRSLEIVFSVREETNSGISSFDFGKLKGKIGVVADLSAPLGSVIMAAPWISDLRIEITGKSVHSSNPENGINALVPASAAISSLTVGRIDDETTCNIGLISGGSATNTVPEKITLTGEVRGFSEEKFKRVLKKIKDTFTKKSKRYGVTLDYQELPYSEGYRLKRNSEEIVAITKANKKLGIKTSFERSFGGSDANAFIKNGIRVVNISDGSFDAHTIEERVAVKDLTKLCEFYKEYIKV